MFGTPSPGRVRRLGLIRSRQIDQERGRKEVWRRDHCTISRGHCRSLQTMHRLDVGVRTYQCNKWECRERTAHTPILPLDLQKLSKRHRSSMPHLPSDAKQVNFKNLDETIPDPSPLRNFKSLGLLDFFGRYRATFGRIDDSFVRSRWTVESCGLRWGLFVLRDKTGSSKGIRKLYS